MRGLRLAALAGLAFGLVGSCALLSPAWAANPDPYVEQASHPTAEQGLILDVIFGRPDAAERLRDRLLDNPRPGVELQKRGWSLLCGASYRGARYQQAIEDCSRGTVSDPDGGDGNTLAIVRLLVDQPALVTRGSARVSLTPGQHIPVVAGAYSGIAIADTGAQISVMMQSVATRAHVRILGRSGSVGSTTASVMGEIGLVPEVRIGSATLVNLPVLVLPDASLTLGGGQVRLPFILSLYAMAGFGRAAWLEHGRVLALGDAAPPVSADAVPMIWHPFGLGVPVDGLVGRRAAHLDSGANVSYLLKAGLPLIAPQERAAIRASTRRIGGVGGVVDEPIQTLPRATLRLAGQSVTLDDVDVAENTDSGEAARIGEDVLNRYAAVVLDFTTMRFSIQP